MQKRKYLFMIIILILIIAMASCTALSPRPAGMTDEEYTAKWFAEVVALQNIIGQKILDTKQNIVNECTTNILISEDDCQNAKQFYNLSADIFDVATSVSKAAIDEENVDLHITTALNKVLLLTDNSTYMIIGGSAITEITQLIKNFPEMDNLTKTEQILNILQNQVLNMTIQLLQIKIEKEGNN